MNWISPISFCSPILNNESANEVDNLAHILNNMSSCYCSLKDMERAVANFGRIALDTSDVCCIEYKRAPSELKAQICTQCGAPLRGRKCEYCGTEFR